MRRSTLAVTIGAAALLSPFATLTAAQAVPQGQGVLIVAHTSLQSEVSDFDTSLADCDSGTVVNGADVVVSFTPWGGVFNGSKEFTCTGDDSGSGFTLRLKARFGGSGSTGSWTVTDGWGVFEGLKGSGSLVGIPQEVLIDDVYTGLFR